jgi:sec-independent protein translocase protein TatA
MELTVLLVVMIFAFGPKRIPEIGKSVGEALAGFRKATKDDDKLKEDNQA